MDWRIKAAAQNAVSLLPSSVSYATYYWIQRHLGGLRSTNPIGGLTVGIETWKRILAAGGDPSDKVFFEVGTGRVPLVPLAYWLMGARRTITVDLNPYLKSELVKETLRYISHNPDEIRRLFGALIRETRLNDLLRLSQGSRFSASAFLDLCSITYAAPSDAGNTSLPSRSVDFHTSCNVFEHISMGTLKAIVMEGNRITTDEGLFVHRIDYSDHFSHSDNRISSVNFLQFSDNEWKRYAGNRYIYMNRLRHDDYMDLLEFAGHRILASDTNVDQRSRDLLRNRGLRLDQRFREKPEDVLSISGAWIVSQKAG